MIRALLADDEAMVRAGVRAILAPMTRSRSLPRQPTAWQRSRQYAASAGRRRTRHPDAADGRTGGRCRDPADRPETSAVMLTTFSEDAYIARALGDRASGFLLKSGDPRELIAGLKAVAEGAAYLSPRVAQRVIAELSAGSGGGAMARAAAAKEQVAVQSPRELEVRRAGRRRTVQRRDRRAALPGRRDREGLCQRRPAAARGEEPGAGRHRRLRGGIGDILSRQRPSDAPGRTLCGHRVMDSGPLPETSPPESNHSLQGHRPHPTESGIQVVTDSHNSGQHKDRSGGGRGPENVATDPLLDPAGPEPGSYPSPPPRRSPTPCRRTTRSTGGPGPPTNLRRGLSPSPSSQPRPGRSPSPSPPPRGPSQQPSPISSRKPATVRRTTRRPAGQLLRLTPVRRPPQARAARSSAARHSTAQAPATALLALPPPVARRRAVSSCLRPLSTSSRRASPGSRHRSSARCPTAPTS